MKSVGSLVLGCLALLPREAFGAGGIHYASNDIITLKSNGNKPDVRIIDFGEAFEGHPTFEVVSAFGNTSVLDVSYAESLSAFNSYMVSRVRLPLEPGAFP
jgi:aminoglycoside/choline kinase family phosphotransferase